MQRVLRNTAATISTTFYVDATATDPAPDTATIKIEREDGTTLVAAGTSTTPTGLGVFSYTLTPAQTASLDILKATWTATLSGYSQSVETFTEIVGGFVCSIPQIDEQLNKGGTASNYSYANKLTARDVATDAFEQEAGVAFTPRYARFTLDGGGTTDLFLSDPRVSTITSASIGGTALSLSDVEVYDYGSLYYSGGWTSGRRNVEIKYEHGHRTPPADVSRAVAILAASLLKDGPFDDRGYGVTDEGGAVRLLTAGVSGASFSIPEVQAALRRHSYVSVA